MTAEEYAKKLGYVLARPRGEWNGYNVFYLVSSFALEDEERMRREKEATGIPATPRFNGLPVYALEKNGDFRTASSKETYEIMGW